MVRGSWGSRVDRRVETLSHPRCPAYCGLVNLPLLCRFKASRATMHSSLGQVLDASCAWSRSGRARESPKGFSGRRSPGSLPRAQLDCPGSAAEVEGLGCSMRPEARDLLKLPEKPAGTAWRALTIRQDGLLQGLPLASPLLAAPPKPSTAWRSPRGPYGNRGLTQEVGPIPGPRNQLDLLSGCRALLAALQSGILPCRELGLRT